MARVSDQNPKGSRKVESRKAEGLTKGAGPIQQIAAEERQRLIAEAAYYRAQKRRFEGGSSVDDWLAAEAEVDRQLLALSTIQPRTPADA